MLKECGICCGLLSVWGVIQLSIMGVFYKMEATPLIGDVEAREYTNFQDFIDKTKENYQTTAKNCWIAAALYVVIGVLSVVCIIAGRVKEKEKLAALNDDDLFCEPPDEPGGQVTTKKKKQVKKN